MSCVSRTVVAACSTAVPSGYKNGDAFGNGLLIGRVVGRVGGSAVDGFALPVTNAHDRRRRSGGVDQILDRDQAAEGRAGIRAGSHLDGSARRSGAGPFSVENGFRVIGIDDSGSAAVVTGLRGWSGRVDLRERT